MVAVPAAGADALRASVTLAVSIRPVAPTLGFGAAMCGPAFVRFRSTKNALYPAGSLPERDFRPLDWPRVA